MKKELVAKQSIMIPAPVSEVWKALTDPVEIRQYFFGTNAISDWKVGSPLIWRGEWNGQSYEDKGEIMEIIPEKKLVYSYWSTFSGKKDTPENYAYITYELSSEGGSTILEVSQGGIADEEQKNHSEENWKTVLNGLKEMLTSRKLNPTR
jgi:uncharacterized protein YndB with AHSA1/START domain